MRKTFTLLLSLAFAFTTQAQTPREEISNNPELAASNYLAYPGPSQKQLTPAPEGYKPVYISHYGRHGSRYHIGKSSYNDAFDILSRAYELGKLTSLGKETYEKVALLTEEARNRDGELTELGAEQHSGIARRMTERFPEVFEGDANVEARSTTVIRCILSMSNELLELYAFNPRLHIFHDASVHDMWYMNLDGTETQKQRENDETRNAYRQWTKQHVDYKPLMKRLFNDDKYVKDSVNVGLLGFRLFRLACNIQSSELRHKLSLWDIYTKDEIYEQWRADNVSWYQRYGFYTLNGGKQPLVQSNLLRRLVEQADSCLKTERPGATLRFGHEVVVLPLACLLGLNGADYKTDNLESLEENGWINYRIFPMASNIQMVFYRRSPTDKDVLVKILLNENEATLPSTVKPVTGPYYRWRDVRKFCLQRIVSADSL